MYKSFVVRKRKTTKSDLTDCLLSHTSSQPTKPQVTAMVFDGAVLVHMLPPKGNKTFSDYAQEVFLPYIKTHLEAVSRVDVVWDVYHPDSLKTSTRENRGQGKRWRVSAKSPVPKN